MPFDATPGSATANSYVTVEAADGYFDFALYRAEWPATSAGADLTKKQQALVSATRWLDSALGFVGLRATSTQKLEWPRGSYTADDHTTGEIPPRVAEAVCDLALYLLQNDPADDVDDELRQFREIQLPGGFDLKMREGARAGQLPARVVEKLSALVASGGGTVRLRRA